MEREWLEARLAEGRSIASIAAEAGKGASTIAYWITKHGLVAAGRDKHAAKRPVDEALLRELVERGLSIRQLAAELGLSPTAVRHWLRRFGLRRNRAPFGAATTSRMPWCASARRTDGRRSSSDGSGRFYGAARATSSGSCVVGAVRRRSLSPRRAAAVRSCGYDRYLGALQFHHVDPATKRFEIGARGLTRAISTSCAPRPRKCVLLCANCHAEVEAGISELRFAAAPADDGG